MSYFRHLLFYGLSAFDAIVNVCAAVCGAYPKVDTATSFLVAYELSRVNIELKERDSVRESHKQNADAKMSEAKGVLDGQDS